MSTFYKHILFFLTRHFVVPSTKLWGNFKAEPFFLNVFTIKDKYIIKKNARLLEMKLKIETLAKAL